MSIQAQRQVLPAAFDEGGPQVDRENSYQDEYDFAGWAFRSSCRKPRFWSVVETLA